MNKLSLSDIYKVYILVKHQNLKLSAKELNIDESTFRRHISQIESVISSKLYVTHSNKIEITPTAISIHDLHLKNIKQYLNEYEYSINKIKTAGNTLRVLCQSDYLKVITDFVSKIKNDIKLNIELISENEFFRLNPKQLLNHYAKFDCILMHEPHQLKMSHQWKIQTYPVKSYFYFHKNNFDTFSNVTIDNLEQYQILNARLFLDRRIFVIDHNNPNKTHKINVRSHVQSDSIRNNLILLSKDKFLLHLPRFIPSLYPHYELIQVPDLYLNYLELNLYYKAELSQPKQSIVNRLRTYLNEIIRS